jgi:hypothetical protein
MCVLSGSWFGLVGTALSTALAFVPFNNELRRPWLEPACLIATEDRVVRREKGRDNHGRMSVSRGADRQTRAQSKHTEEYLTCKEEENLFALYNVIYYFQITLSFNKK